MEEYSKDGQCTITLLPNQDNEVLAHWYQTDYDSSAGEYIEGYLYKRVIQQFVAMLSQKEKEFGFANLFHNLFFLPAQFNCGLPDLWLHALPPHE